MATGNSSMANGRLSTGKPKRQDSPTSEANPSKLYSKSRSQSQSQSHLLFRALIAALLFIVVPMLPSIAPDSLSPHSPFSFTPQSWELLHLILVGIAVSYGLFSRRSDDTGGGGESNPIFDSSSSSSYASKLLQVASLFDEDGVDSSPTSSSGSSCDDGRNKFRAWSSQYYRNEPSTMVVLPKKSAEQLTEHLNSSSSSLVRDDERPLLLPIRSLKSPVSDANVRVSNGDIRRTSSSPASASNSTEYSDGPRTKTRLVAAKSSGGSGSYSRSNSTSSSDSTDLNEGTNDVLLFGGGLNEGCCKAEEESAVVLPSPIPWRSRSTSTTSRIREMIQQSNNNNDDDNTDQFFRSHTCQSSQSSSASSTIKVSPFSPSSTPKSSSPNKPRHPPSTSSLAKRTEDLVRRKSMYKSPPPPPPSSLQSAGLISDEVSVRKDFKHKPQGFISDGLDYLVDQGTALPGFAAKETTKFDSPSAGVGKSLRTMKAVGDSAPVSSITQEGVALGEEQWANDWKTVSTSEEDAQVTLAGKSDGNLHGSASAGSSRRTLSLSHYEKEPKDFFDQVLVETDDDEEDNSEIEEGNGVESENAVTRVSSSTNDMGDDGPDVDKKADEFIARFREQIRLQRIESIKRSSGQFSRNK